MRPLVQIAVALGAMVAIALGQPPFKQHAATSKPTKAASPSGRP